MRFPQGATRVAFTYRGGSVAGNIVIAGTTGPAYANGGAFGVIQVPATGVPAKMGSVQGTGGNAGTEVTELAIDK